MNRAAPQPLHLFQGTRRRRMYFGIALFLTLLIPITWAFNEAAQSRLSANEEVRQVEEVERAVEEIDANMERLQASMLDLAETVVTEPVVQQAVRAMQGPGDASEGRPEQAPLIQFISQLPLSAYTAVELYTPDDGLIAWNGFGMPLNPKREQGPLPETLQTNLAADAYGREAVVLWVPVQVGARVLGAVRVVRLVEVNVFVHSPYLQAYTLTDGWPLVSTAELDVSFGEVPAPTQGVDSLGRGARQVRLLGVDGTELGRVTVSPPAVATLSRALDRRFGHVLSFWAALLAGWLAAGGWSLYRTWTRRLDDPNAVSRRSLGAAFLWIGFVWWGLRYVLLWLNIPGRWFYDTALFDPTHLASELGGGLARSIGDLLVTSVFALFFALMFLGLVARYTFPQWKGQNQRLNEVWTALWKRLGQAKPMVLVGGGLLCTLSATGLMFGLGVVTRRVILDSTLDYFAWTGLSPEALVLTVFCTLLLVTLAVVLLIIGLFWFAVWVVGNYLGTRRLPDWMMASAGAVVVLPVVGLYLVFSLNTWVPWWVLVSACAIGCCGVFYGLGRWATPSRVLVLRGILFILLLSTGVLYPLVYQSMKTQRQMRMTEVANDYVERRNAEARVLIEHVLADVHDGAEVKEFMESAGPLRRVQGDTVLAASIQVTQLPFLEDHTLSVMLVGADGSLLGYHRAGLPGTGTEGPGEADVSPFDVSTFRAVRDRYQARSGMYYVEQVRNPVDPENVRSIGLMHLGEEAVQGWVLVAANRRTMRIARQSPTLVLDEAGGLANWRSALSVAEYRGVSLVRSEGGDFARVRLPGEVSEALAVHSEIWRTETIYGRQYVTYYRRQQPEAQAVDEGRMPSVLAVRMRAVIPYDHLYYSLRITVAGLWIGLVFYLMGLVLRRRAGLLPAPQQSFNDKVLNAFLGVGIVAVVFMGWIGQQVILRENLGAIQSRLERRLERVEHALSRRARFEEPLYQVLERVPVDTLALELSLDLNVYDGPKLIRSSTTEEQAQLLAYTRLPVKAYEDLYLNGFRQSFVTMDADRDIFYTIGYKALNNEEGVPQAVVAVLTIPEQERIREERARTTAYLFGALLLLLLIIMGTATVFANRLTQPMRRLHDGLESVAAGKFQRPIPVESNDEVGGLVRAFNGMQEQLAESRRKLGQQERELAWREMAKQVAHEIKNPLTPMKLSIQHLQRAYVEADGNPERQRRFAHLFGRITQTLTEQIDTLARIANEFSTFARLPKQHFERLDLNDSIREAVDLLREETGVRIELALWADPLVVKADREELRRVYINLLKNAVQAIPRANEGTVTVQTWREGAGNGASGYAFSAVTDTGTGIPAEVRERIFQPNFSTKTSGMGLGLAIVKKSVEDMKGEIDFVTWEQAGTTFKVKLPLDE